MNKWTWYTAAIMVAMSFILSYYGLWFLIFIPGGLSGLALNKKYEAIIPSIFSAAGTSLYMSTDISYRLREASLFDSIAGLPSGYLLPLVLVLTITFAISLLGLLIGSSFSVVKTTPQGNSIK